jgi:hypothetical protein
MIRLRLGQVEEKSFWLFVVTVIVVAVTSSRLDQRYRALTWIKCVYRESGSWDTRTFDQENCLGRRDMTNAYAVPEDRITLDMIVARLNVERFSKMLSEEADEAKRQTLAHLITEEKAKLDALFPRAFT